MKPTVLCLMALALAGTGCFSFTRGVQESGEARPRAAMVAEPPHPVKPEEVQEASAREALGQLEDEIAFDEEVSRTVTPSEGDPTRE